MRELLPQIIPQTQREQNQDGRVKIKLDWNGFEPLPHIDTTPVFRAAERMAVQKEADILRFADHFKTRRVYCAEWMEDKGTRIDFCWKLFSFEYRSFAFDCARHYHGNVLIYHLSPLLNMPSKCIVCMSHLPNGRLAEELWKTFNECCRCHQLRLCKDVLFMGKKQRMCLSCLDYFAANYFVQTKGNKYEKIFEHPKVKDCADCIRNPRGLRPRTLQARQGRNYRNLGRSGEQPEASTDSQAKVQCGPSTEVSAASWDEG